MVPNPPALLVKATYQKYMGIMRHKADIAMQVNNELPGALRKREAWELLLKLTIALFA